MSENTNTQWHTDDGMIDLADQLDMCRENIGTDREWQSITIHDEDGPAEVVALCHPINAPLIAAAPEAVEMMERLRLCCNPLLCEMREGNESLRLKVEAVQKEARALYEKAKGTTHA